VGCHSPATAATRIEVQFPERVDRSFIHRGNYVARHSVDAMANPQTCRVCHGSGSCDACHAANGFSATSTAPVLLKPSTHDANWASNVPGNPNRHAQEARRDISSCAGCHDQQGNTQTCVGCHKVGGLAGGNPHPRQFLDKHSASDRAHNAMCRTCHTNG
jgi:hypothetical protein